MFTRADRHWIVALLAGALAAGLGSATGARGDTDLGGAVLSGELEAGGKFLTGDWGSAQFREYQDQQPGFFGQGDLLLEDAEHSYYLGLGYDYVGSDDQTYEGRFGSLGKWGVDLQYMQFPYDYSETGQTLYLRSDSTYRLAPPLQASIQATAAAAGKSALLGRALENARGVNLESMYRLGRAEAKYLLPGDMQARIGFSAQHRNGAKPLGLGFGSPGGNFANFAGQLDDWTYNANAGIDFIRDSWSLAFDYDGSFYNNEIGQLTVANPLRATNSATAGSAFGRVSRAPDNEANTFTVTGGWKVPIAVPTRLTGTFSYGQRTQDDDFLPHTVNGVIAAANATSLVLPEQRLDGLIETYLANLVATSQLTESLDARVRYRYYDYDNKTPTLMIPADVVNDATFTPGEVSSTASSYRRQNTSADLTYRFARPFSMTLGYEWEQWKRSSNRERIYADTNTGRISANLRPNERIQLRATYELSARAGSDYRPYAPLAASVPAEDVATDKLTGQFALLRKFDQANRWRNEANLLAQIMLTESLDATIAGGFGNNSYDASKYGLQDWQDWNIGIDLGYKPFDWLGFKAGYDYQDVRADQKDRLRNVAGGVAIDNPINDWWSRWHATMQNAYAGMDVTVVPRYVDVHFGYGLQLSRDRTSTNGVSGGPFRVDLNWPTDTNTLQYVTTRIDYHVTEMLTLRAAWRWERFDIHDFRRSSSFYPYNPNSNVTTATGAISPSTDVFLGDRPEDYNVNIVGFSAILSF